MLRARHVWLGPGQVLSPGEVSLDADGCVVSVRPARRKGRTAPWLLVPGLVNAHVHLQVPSLAAAPTDFVAWVRAVIAWRRRPESISRSKRRTQASIAELLRSGCTAVGEIDSLGTSPAALRDAAIAGRCYQELLGFDLTPGAARALVAARQVRGSASCAAGLSPHAPYSCSIALLRAARRATPFLTVHVAEIAAELELLQAGAGPLRTLLEELGRWPRSHRPPRCTPVEWLQAGGALGPRSLLVHLQEATQNDIELVRRSRAKVAVCPPTILFFGRRAPDVTAWMRRGLRVALGTDSRASSRRPLSMCDAMADARRLWPGLSPHTVLAMATSHAAAAIGRPSLGRIAPGGRGDLCAFALTGGSRLADSVDAATAGALPVCGTWLRGHRVFGTH